jgi:hypothetical protein
MTMPMCDEMCNGCGTTDGVCMVKKLCDACETRGDLTSQKQPETIGKDACVSDDVGKALEDLDWIEKAYIDSNKSILNHDDTVEERNFKLQGFSAVKRKAQTIRAELERKQEPIDVDEIKRECLDDICKGRNITEKNVVYDIISESVNLMEHKGYLTQSAEKDAAVRDLAGDVRLLLRVINSLFSKDYGVESLTKHAAAIEAAEKGGE